MTKLLGPNDMSFFPIHEYREVLSPVVEPVEATTEAVINGYLADLGFLDPRPSSLKKLSVLLCSFLMQSMRLQGRVERRGGRLIIGSQYISIKVQCRSTMPPMTVSAKYVHLRPSIMFSDKAMDTPPKTSTTAQAPQHKHKYVLTPPVSPFYIICR